MIAHALFCVFQLLDESQTFNELYLCGRGEQLYEKLFNISNHSIVSGWLVWIVMEVVVVCFVLGSSSTFYSLVRFSSKIMKKKIEIRSLNKLLIYKNMLSHCHCVESRIWAHPLCLISDIETTWNTFIVFKIIGRSWICVFVWLKKGLIPALLSFSSHK